MRLEWKDLWNLYCPDEPLPFHSASAEWLLTFAPAPEVAEQGPVAFCDWLGRLYAIHADENYRKKHGQFFTPPEIARYMAKLAQPVGSGGRVLEPGAGTGILIAALAECWMQEHVPSFWQVSAYESDPSLRPALTLALGFIRHWLGERGVRFSFTIHATDFILDNLSRLRPAPLLDEVCSDAAPQLVISNPPYLKLPKTDPRVAVLSEVVYGQPNLYTLFMAGAAKLLQAESGQLVFIVPRSFCSGLYFRKFRRWFFQTIRLQRVHLFESRTEAFSRDEVLQENLILVGAKTTAPVKQIGISNSYGATDLEAAPVRWLAAHLVIDPASVEAVLNLPTASSDSILHEFFQRWPDRLNTLGFEISTGPVVPFRTRALVEHSGSDTAPLLWVHHIGRMAVTWPLTAFPKPQYIRVDAESRGLLLPNQNYVLVRRFSPKEENSRITAAPCLKGAFPGDLLGVENHVNYIHKPGGIMSQAEALGLAAFLNSRWVDQYFRISSGNTQVSATELRALPLPPLEQLRRIGQRLEAANGLSIVGLVNRVVSEELGLALDLTSENGVHMSKIEEAKDLLTLLGLPRAQRNELAALTLLALANLRETTPWSEAERRSIRIHDMIGFVEQNYRKRYAENTRETFRRQVLHHFEQARLVDRNPDDPSLPTNSPRTHYALSEAVMPVLRSYGASSNQRELEKFRAKQETLLEAYQKNRRRTLIPVKTPEGQEYRLSPGRHSQLQAAVIEQFAPRFAPGARLLYLGDTANKILLMDTRALKRLGFPVDKHGKLPDVVLYSPRKKWLFLIEAVTSHGPVSHKRWRELEDLLAESPVGRVYVSAFLDFQEYKRHSQEIAWETEVWIAEIPDHLLHYNGDRFLGPRAPSRRSR